MRRLARCWNSLDRFERVIAYLAACYIVVVWTFTVWTATR